MVLYLYFFKTNKNNNNSLLSSSLFTSRDILILERKQMFNDVLNTFYLRLYDVRHIVKNDSDSKRGDPLPPHRQLFPINNKGSFICISPQTHTTAFVTPVVGHWLERELAQWVNHKGSIRRPIAPLSYI